MIGDIERFSVEYFLVSLVSWYRFDVVKLLFVRNHSSSVINE